uniref:Uncharacterized protein n=1 Tax=Rhizophora mucronata TaxID=61149 RepID=A0A2P2NQD7_RHIMU
MISYVVMHIVWFLHCMCQSLHSIFGADTLHLCHLCCAFCILHMKTKKKKKKTILGII